MFKALLTALLLWSCLQPSAIQADAGHEVRHILSFPEKHNQYVHVRSEFEAAAGSIDLFLPSWSPGSYVIRDFAANLERIRAVDSTGRTMALVKISKNQWRVEAISAGRLTIEYDVWAGRINVAESWVEDSRALLNGAGLFLYNEKTLGLPQSLEIVLPADWAAIHTSLARPADETRFLARSYDELVDSPVLLGNTVELPFTVNDQEYALVLSEANRFWDGEQSVQDLAKIVEAQHEFWGDSPFDRKYLFLNLFMEKFGGLEHDHSTVMMCNPWQMRGRQDYIKWLALASHEFFHSWNVRRMRPRALAGYDYQKEVYTRELWLAEGLTSYYDNLLLFRAGVIEVVDYMNLLAEEIRNYETTPGREVRSAELASFDTWIKHYKPDSNKLNNTISYYRKGALIGFVTDTELRRQTNNRFNLDDVMRKMYAQYGPSAGSARGYPTGAFEDAVESFGGEEVRKRVEEMLKTTGDPDVDKALDWYGLALDRTPGLTPDQQAPAGMGVDWKDSGTALVAEHVLLGYPAAAAGVLPGDELLAIDGFRVTPEDFAQLFQKLLPGDQVELTVARHGRLQTLPLTVGTEIPLRYSIVTQKKMSQRQKRRLAGWLGRDLKFPD
ncbi:MAG: M61 family metallopeptidase [Xanthomonadales bacterium]|nr:PDZ domain-containing protein [Gammaproteobacteria bacterium]MBT8054962.1 PDZ domain-containing protein [Gammaproteobacteria bacterium]NND56344.1 M61 family metallopeptidase [Xanthomonadales bacterium]NNK52884.1 M61 family metallopeptidase [Xanthomonadales bacterium]